MSTGPRTRTGITMGFTEIGHSLQVDHQAARAPPSPTQ